MKLLAIDTSTEACSAALMIDGETIEKYELAPRRHAELILMMVDELLQESAIPLKDLDALAFAQGPGAFTGVRLSTSVAQGLAYAASLPVVPVSTLATLAQGANSKANTIISAIDARMHEIYYGLFKVDDDKVITSISPEIVCKPGDIESHINNHCYGVGSGWEKYGDILSDVFGSTLQGYEGEKYPRAKDIVTLARKKLISNDHVIAHKALPVYLRNSVVN